VATPRSYEAHQTRIDRASVTKVLASFGHPVAHENDAERAVRRALATQRSLAELKRKNDGAGKPTLAARIAIDSAGSDHGRPLQ
jgi:class 3 adenylate cyclase